MRVRVRDNGDSDFVERKTDHWHLDEGDGAGGYRNRYGREIELSPVPQSFAFSGAFTPSPLFFFLSPAPRATFKQYESAEEGCWKISSILSRLGGQFRRGKTPHLAPGTSE